MIRALEARFSLYNPGSDLSRLNAAGRLDRLHPWMAELLAACGKIHRLTQGRFDPTVQSLWTAPPGPSGWERVRLGRDAVQLAPGQSLTLNGIAQGYAADRISALLARHGFADTLADLGEFRARGGPWRLGLADPEQGLMGYRTLAEGAVFRGAAAEALLDGAARLEDLARLLLAGHGNEGAAVAHQLDHPVAGQHRQRAADRGAVAGKDVDELLFAELRAGAQFLVRDGIEDMVDDLLFGRDRHRH